MVDYFGATWWDVSFPSWAVDTVLQENLFGGNQMHFGFQTWWYDWNSDTVRLKDLFTYAYLTAPGSTVPINGGGWTVQFRGGVGFENPTLYVFPDVRDGILHHKQFQSAPSGYWAGRYPTVSPP